MRLGQLARKLELRPIDIVDFLREKNIVIDSGTNTKVDDEHAKLVIQQFAPTMSLGEAEVPDIHSSSEPIPEEASTEIVVQEMDGTVTLQINEPDQQIETPDVIKAPKIELSGLKIIGKIDLPESKKKEAEGNSDNLPSEKVAAREIGREKQKARTSRPHRSGQNPIALKREQEALEARRKREEELQHQKEKRTQNYLKKVKAPQPTKAVKFVKEKTEQMSAAELAEPPKTLWGRFVKWLTT